MMQFRQEQNYTKIIGYVTGDATMKRKNFVVAIFCHGDEESGFCTCTRSHLTTADQSKVRKAYLASAKKWRR